MKEAPFFWLLLPSHKPPFTSSSAVFPMNVFYAAQKMLNNFCRNVTCLQKFSTRAVTTSNRLYVLSASTVLIFKFSYSRNISGIFTGKHLQFYPLFLFIFLFITLVLIFVDLYLSFVSFAASSVLLLLLPPPV